jgi:hypothetical protein
MRWVRYDLPITLAPVRSNHALDGFDCGEEALNRFLLRFAFQNPAADIAGIRAFAVHAKNEKARALYERFDSGRPT